MDDLPSDIIAEFASYLNQKEYGRFACTCSSIYHPIHSPNQLRKISVSVYHKNKVPFKTLLTNHPQLTKLGCINITKFDELQGIQPAKFIVNNLTELEIQKCGNETFDVENMLNQKYINLENLKFVYSEIQSPQQTDIMYTILSKSPNIEKLFFMDMQHEVTINDKAEIARNKFPKLKDLQLYLCGGIHWLQIFGHQLERLALFFMDNFIGTCCADNLRNLNLQNLQLLEVEFFYPSQLNAIIESAINIKEIIIYNHIDYDNDAENIKQVICNLLVNMKNLQHLHVMVAYVEDWDIQNEIDLMFDGIEYGLSLIKKRKRDKFKITLQYVDELEDEIVLYFKKVIKQLIESDIDKFMIRIQFPNYKHTLQQQQQIINHVINTLQEYVSLISVSKMSENDWVFQN